MPTSSKPGRKGSDPYKHQDWVCILCQNLNYSFREKCNRCQTQTKENNQYMRLCFQQQQKIFYEHLSTLKSELYFPKSLFVVINDQPWEQISCSMQNSQIGIPFQSPKNSETENKWVQFLMDQ